ncbi:hypothetical protein Ancab_032972 [Ancistrocladus abbreviatus]
MVIWIAHMEGLKHLRHLLSSSTFLFSRRHTASVFHSKLYRAIRERGVEMATPVNTDMDVDAVEAAMNTDCPTGAASTCSAHSDRREPRIQLTKYGFLKFFILSYRLFTGKIKKNIDL